MDCGPTCIRMVAKHYGNSVNMETLRLASQISKEGVSLLGIAEAAEKIGFNAKGVTLSYDELTKEARLPAILHWEQNHFVVLYKVKGRFFFRRNDEMMVADPGKGMVSYTKQEFLNHWISTKDEHTGEPLGVALLLEPTPAFYEQEENDEDSPRGNKLGWGRSCTRISLYRK